jgi:hypothetical protein
LYAFLISPMPVTSFLQSISSHPISLRYSQISSHLHLGLPSCLFPSGFPTKILYAFLNSPMRAAYTTQLIYLLLGFRMEETALRYESWLRIYWISSRAQPQKGWSSYLRGCARAKNLPP